jgi:hypothetical protein
MTRATFVATLEVERAAPAKAGESGQLVAVRIRFYQVM